MSDRILVMRDGRIAGELPAKSTEQDIMLVATGHSKDQDLNNHEAVGGE
jgi:ribose transport system ATP-binding protein